MDWAIAAAAAGVDQNEIMDAAMMSPGRFVNGPQRCACSFRCPEAYVLWINRSE